MPTNPHYQPNNIPTMPTLLEPESQSGSLDSEGVLGLADVIALAERAHAGQHDQSGMPYIEHVRRVVAAVAVHGVKVQMAAALHDVVEDTPWTLDALRSVGVPPDVLEAVDALTKHSAENYEDAVRRAAAQPIAHLVKIADNMDNADEDRLRQLDPVVAERLRAKYTRARDILLGTG